MNVVSSQRAPGSLCQGWDSRGQSEHGEAEATSMAQPAQHRVPSRHQLATALLLCFLKPVFTVFDCKALSTTQQRLPSGFQQGLPADIHLSTSVRTHPSHAHTCAHMYAHKHTHTDKASSLVSNCSFCTGSWQEGGPGRWCSACGSGRQLTLMWLPRNRCARQGLQQPVPHHPLLLLDQVSGSLLLSPKRGLVEGLFSHTDICPPAGRASIPPPSSEHFPCLYHSRHHRCLFLP